VTSFRILGSAVAIAALGVLAGCTVEPPANDNGVDEGPLPGEEGGACYQDGTCNEGLQCADNICGVAEGNDNGNENGNGSGDDGDDGSVEERTLLIFHNGSGPMCLSALDWLDGIEPQYPALVVEEHLTYEAGERETLVALEQEYQTSQGVSTSFGYLPIMFFEGQAFSGFNDEIAADLEELFSSGESSGP
jgi:hypothetical protein